MTGVLAPLRERDGTVHGANSFVRIADLPIRGLRLALALGLLLIAHVCHPRRREQAARMTYESGMDPIHDTRRRFDVRFHLLAIAFLVFDVELLFLYPWAVVEGEWRVERGAWRVKSEVRRVESGKGSKESQKPLAVSQSRDARLPSLAERRLIFAGVMAFVALLTAGFVYDWRKGVFQWR